MKRPLVLAQTILPLKVLVNPVCPNWVLAFFVETWAFLKICPLWATCLIIIMEGHVLGMDGAYNITLILCDMYPVGTIVRRLLALLGTFVGLWFQYQVVHP